MKNKRPRRTIITLADLLPTNERMMEIAYTSTAGDPAALSIGRHAGRDPKRRDTMGITKRMIYERALARDLGWFEAHAAWIKFDPFRWPPSLRAMVPKDRTNRSGGTRPIDDPAEVKRLVRDVLARKLAARFTDGQLGGRRADLSPVYCERKGATSQDQVATAIWKTIGQGYTWCVLIDLEDAFGRVPEVLALQELKAMGVSDEAARFIWRLVRIDAVLRSDLNSSSKTQQLITRKGMGIEQGNALSADLMNLVLAPVLRRVEARMDVRTFTYLDDIYLMCRNEAEAREAYSRFKAIAKGLGFDNVRALWKPGRKAKGKLSQVVDTALNPVRVLKTYDVNGLGTSLAPDKVAEVREAVIKESPDGIFKRMTINEVRKVSGCQALTGQAMSSRTNLMKRRLKTSSTESPSGTGSPSSSSGATSKCIETDSPRGITSTDDEPVSLGRWEEPPPPYGEGNPVEDPDCPTRLTASFNGGSSTTSHVHDVDREAPLLSLPMDAGYGLPLRGSSLDGLHLHDEHSDADVDLPVGGDAHVRVSSSIGCRPSASSSQAPQAGSAPIQRDEGSCTTEGLHKSRRRGRADDEDRPSTLLLSNPVVRASLLAGHGIKLGVQEKGSVLDLSGLTEFKLRDHLIVEVVNALIKAVRFKRTAQVIIDPAESWTACSKILGGVDDRAYELETQSALADGRRLLALRRRARGSSHSSHEPTFHPPVGADGVLAVVHVDRAMHVYELDVVEDGERRRIRMEVAAPGPTGGAALAVAAWADTREQRPLALPASGSLGALTVALLDGTFSSPDIAFSDGVRRLQGERSWRATPGGVAGRTTISQRARAPLSCPPDHAKDTGPNSDRCS